MERCETQGFLEAIRDGQFLNKGAHITAVMQNIWQMFLLAPNLSRITWKHMAILCRIQASTCNVRQACQRAERVHWISHQPQIQPDRCLVAWGVAFTPESHQWSKGFDAVWKSKVPSIANRVVCECEHFLNIRISWSMVSTSCMSNKFQPRFLFHQPTHGESLHVYPPWIVYRFSWRHWSALKWYPRDRCLSRGQSHRSHYLRRGHGLGFGCLSDLHMRTFNVLSGWSSSLRCTMETRNTWTTMTASGSTVNRALVPHEDFYWKPRLKESSNKGET